MPARDNFEEPDFNRKYEPVQKDDLSGVDLIFPNQSPKGPIEDPVNQDPWVLVVDGKQFPAQAISLARGDTLLKATADTYIVRPQTYIVTVSPCVGYSLIKEPCLLISREKTTKQKIR